MFVRTVPLVWLLLSSVFLSGCTDQSDLVLFDDGSGSGEFTGDTETGLDCRLWVPKSGFAVGRTATITVEFLFKNPRGWDGIEVEFSDSLTRESGSLSSQGEFEPIENMTFRVTPNSEGFATIRGDFSRSGSIEPCRYWNLDVKA